jgi:hypothetical protein
LRLFTRTALCLEVELVRKEPLPPITWQQFQRTDPGAEVSIRFGRGSKEHFRDAVHFWLAVLGYWFRDANRSEAEAFFARLVGDSYTLCQEISCEELGRIVQWYDFVETAHDFSPHEPFCRAWLVYDTGIEIATLAETQQVFTVFSWELND